MNILKIGNLIHYYQDGDKKREILKGINYDFDEGIVYTICGPSGSGKTTLLSIIAGLDSQCSGTILYKDKDIRNIGLTNYRKNYSSIIFQNYNLIPYLSSLQNIEVSLEISGNTNSKKEKAKELLEQVGFDEAKMNREVSKLSGGEQQRVAIARALSSSANIILADEPTGNLDVDTANDIIDIFKKLAHEYNKCIIIVTHSTELTKASDIKLKLKDGLLVGS